MGTSGVMKRDDFVTFYLEEHVTKKKKKKNQPTNENYKQLRVKKKNVNKVERIKWITEQVCIQDGQISASCDSKIKAPVVRIPRNWFSFCKCLEIHTITML